MTSDHFPDRIQSLPRYAGRFEAFQIANPDVDVLLASYPAGTAIEPHTHDTENCGVITQGELILITDGQEQRYKPGDWYHLPPNQVHAARFEVATSEIEFWFKSSQSDSQP
jgi:quercetin dioxygenase-like cupin family protein